MHKNEIIYKLKKAGYANVAKFLETKWFPNKDENWDWIA